MNESPDPIKTPPKDFLDRETIGQYIEGFFMTRN